MSVQTLDRLCSLIVDSEHKTAPKDSDGLHPLMRTNNLARGRGDFRGAQRVNAQTYSLWTKRACPQSGDLILAREAPVGGICRVPPNVLPVLGQRTVLLRPRPDVADSQFLLYRLAAPDMQARMHEMATGATVPHLNMADIRAFVVPDVPEMEEQRRRSAILETLDELVAVNERRIEILDRVAASLYRERVVRVLSLRSHEPRSPVVPGPDVVPVFRRLADVAQIVMGQSPRSEFYNDVGDGLPFHQGVSDYGSLMPTHRVFSTAGPRRALAGDILCSVRAPVGRLNLVDRELVIGRGLAAIRRINGQMAVLFEQLKHALGAEDSIGGGTIYKAVGKDELAGLRVLEPADQDRDELERMLHPMLEKRMVLTSANRRLATTRDLLLPRLVTGRLDMSDIDLGDLLEPEAA